MADGLTEFLAVCGIFFLVCILGFIVFFIVSTIYCISECEKEIETLKVEIKNINK